MAGASPSHMIVMPRGFLALRIFQTVLAAFVLSVCIYGATGAPIAGIVLNIFTACATIITLIYVLVATHGLPAIYHYWAILALEIFCLVFWLISFALLADDVAIAAAYTCGGGYYYYGYYYYGTCTDKDLGLIGLFGACAGIGSLEFILFIVSLSLFGVALARHRSNGGHCVPEAQNLNQDFGHEKVKMQPQTQVYPAATTPAQGSYPPQAVDARYGTAPATQDGQQHQQVS